VCNAWSAAGTIKSVKAILSTFHAFNKAQSWGNVEARNLTGGQPKMLRRGLGQGGTRLTMVTIA